MKLYSTMNSIPELAGLPKAQQRMLWQRATRHAQRRGKLRWVMGLWTGLPVFGMGAARQVSDGQPVAAAIMILITLGVLGASHQLMVRVLRPYLVVERATIHAPSASDTAQEPPAR